MPLTVFTQRNFVADFLQAKCDFTRSKFWSHSGKQQALELMWRRTGRQTRMFQSLLPALRSRNDKAHLPAQIRSVIM